MFSVRGLRCPLTALYCVVMFLILAMVLQLSDVAVSKSQAVSEPPPRDCTAAQFQLLDFLIGKWTLRAVGLPGFSNVQFERALNGCLLIETIEGPDTHRGKNVIVYDRVVEQWRYLAVNSNGDVIALMGRQEGKTVSFQGEGPGSRGGRVFYKLRFELSDDGSVRELWEGSRDGITWRRAFDGTFTRAPQ